jgi:NAD(P)-dependent dehydrogenase (short-subunit alcohol dehydrogenase family)
MHSHCGTSEYANHPKSVRAALCKSVARVVDEFGGLDVLASNAGVEHFGALESITDADFDRVFRINVAGQLFATQAAVSAMALNLAPELAERGIAINAIAPGGTATDMAAEVGPTTPRPRYATSLPTRSLDR